MHDKCDALVVGGGVIGLACAHYLNKAGHSVRLIEQDRIGAGASHGNCGLIFTSDLVPLTSPGAVRHVDLQIPVHRPAAGRSTHPGNERTFGPVPEGI